MRASFKKPKNKHFWLFLATICGIFILLGPRLNELPNAEQEKKWDHQLREASKAGPKEIRARCTLASSQVSLPQETPIGGYLWPRSSQQAGAIQVGVMLIGEAPAQIAVVSAGVLLFTPLLAKEIRSQFSQKGIAKTLFTATHTHSGPGGFGLEGLEKIVLGHHPPTKMRLVDALNAALQKAALQQPQPMYVAHAKTNVLLRRTASTEPLDDRASLIQCGDDQLWVMHAAHPVTEKNNLQLSGDWPQLLVNSLKKDLFAEVLYASSSGGEVSLARPKGREHTVKKMVRAIKKALPQKTLLNQPLNLQEAFFQVPPLTIPITSSWHLTGPMTKWFFPTTEHATIQILYNDRLHWFFLPYETSAAIWGPFLKKQKSDRFIFHSPFNGEYLGYILPQQRHGHPGPEQALSLLGSQAASNHLDLINHYLSVLAPSRIPSSIMVPE